ncbi:hypothetical protein HWV62_40816 [Athelia sp. TMB]|nr:hypothetical protein HWV62_40816 [Athelia sp. TMB]
MTIAEVVVFVASKAYQENSEAVAKGVIGELSSVPGIESSYNGFQYEDEVEGGVKKAVWINVWDSYESAEKQSERLKSFFKEESKVEICHVRIGADISRPISAPVTEIAWVVLKPGQSVEALAKSIDELEEAVKTLEGAHSSTWGPTVEDPNVFVGIIGWDTREAHLKAVAPGTGAFKVIGKTLETSDIKLLHVDLTKFSA